MYFQIEGTKGGTGTTTKYNVYRDGVLIAGNITTTFYTDTDFITTTGHTWKVTTVCEADESEPATVTKGICETTTTYTITASVNGVGGTIEPEGTTTVTHGGSQTYTITPNAEHKILEVLIDGVNNQGAVETGTFTFTNVTANHTIVAVFQYVGINENKYANLIVYPNPTNGELRITNYEFGITNIEIFDVYGRKHLTGLPSYGLTVSNLNISHLPAGIYFLRIDETIVKVVKQ
jgi:hypothetical protein